MSTDRLLTSQPESPASAPEQRPRTPGTRAASAAAGVLDAIRGLTPMVLLLAGWQAVGDPQSPFFPPPSEWWRGLATIWSRGELLASLWATTVTFLLALVLSVTVGAVLGGAVGRSRLLDAASRPTFEFFRTMPSAALVPVFVLVLGYSLVMKVAVVTFTCVWPVLLATRHGRRTLPRALEDVGRTLHLAPVSRIRKITLPALLPSILLGTRIAGPMCLIVTLLVEIITQVAGLGALISSAQRNFRPAEMYGLVLVAGVLALAVNHLIVTLEARLLRYRR